MILWILLVVVATKARSKNRRAEKEYEIQPKIPVRLGLVHMMRRS